MIVDAHVHMGKMQGLLNLEAETDFIIEMSDEAGIDRVVVTHLTALFYDMYEGNRLLSEALNKYPDRMLGWATISSPNYGQEAIDEVRRCVEEDGMVGMKMYSSLASPISEPAAIEVIAGAADMGIPILAHSDPWACEKVCQELPEAMLIMAHMGNTVSARGDWNRAIDAARRYDNLILDISGSSHVAGFVEAAVEAIGPLRVIFGSDLPIFDQRVQMAKVTGSDLSQEAKSLILGGNILRILGIQDGQEALS
jgi:predicted TIM-barrel fold metal-dependent hydrolase